MQRLIVASASCELALAIATNARPRVHAVRLHDGQLRQTVSAVDDPGYVFSVPFFLLTVRTSQKRARRPA